MKRTPKPFNVLSHGSIKEDRFHGYNISGIPTRKLLNPLCYGHLRKTHSQTPTSAVPQNPKKTFRFQNAIAEREAVEVFSIEELRLAIYDYIDASHKNDRDSLDMEGFESQQRNDAVISSINEDDIALCNELARCQKTLFKLIILAERLCWQELFNATMDAFLDGEEQVMRRVYVPPSFIEMAYTQCPDGSPVRRLVADMAHFKAKTSHTLTNYIRLAHRFKDFLADLFVRLEEDSELAVCNPLKAPRYRYHIQLE